jgi:hypothetical protein
VAFYENTDYYEKAHFDLRNDAHLICWRYAQNPIKYCDLTVYRPFFKNYVAEMHVDGNVKTSQTLLRDNAGKPMKFASESDAVNYVAQQGWELVTAYNRHGGESHFFLKKNI